MLRFSQARRNRGPNYPLLIGLGLFALLCIPLALNAVSGPVHYLPKAYVRDTAKSIDGSTPNSPPSLDGSSFTPIRCTLGKTCQYTFRGTDKDLNDSLNLTVDFLPPDLKLNDCQTSQNFVGYKRLSCDLNGIPEKPGNYKILATLTDNTNQAVTKSFTLSVQ